MFDLRFRQILIAGALACMATTAIADNCKVLSDPGTYEGECKDGLANGKGVFVLDTGDRYEGDFVNGKMAGKGKILWVNGNRYEGDFINGQVTGKGKAFWEDGRRYEGDVVNAKPHGEGKFTLSNGDTYEGHFVRGKARYDATFRKGEVSASTRADQQVAVSKPKTPVDEKLDLCAAIQFQRENSNDRFNKLRNIHQDQEANDLAYSTIINQALKLIAEQPQSIKVRCQDGGRELTPLELALLFGKSAIVDALIKAGADPNEGSYFNSYGLLIETLYRTNTRTALLLWKAGAKFGSASEEARARIAFKDFFLYYDRAGGDPSKAEIISPVIVAIQKQDYKAFEAAILKEPMEIDAKGPHGEDAIAVLLDNYPYPYYRNTFPKKSIDAPIEIVRKLIDGGLRFKQPNAILPIMWRDVWLKFNTEPAVIKSFVEAGILDQLKASFPLLDAQSNKLFYEDYSSFTVGKKFFLEQELMQAIDEGQLATADLLLKHGAQINVEQSSIIPLIFKANNDATWQLALKSLPLSQENINQMLLLVVSTGKGSPSVVQTLLDKGADVNQNSQDEKGRPENRSLIVKVADSGPSEYLDLLLKKKPALPDFYTEALSSAKAHDHTKVDYWLARARQFKVDLYHESYAKAVSSDSQIAFITIFAENDPDKLVPQVKGKLRQALLSDGKWDSLVTAWEHAPDKVVLARMTKEAKTTSQKGELEAIVVAKLPASAVFEAAPINFGKIHERRGYDSGKVDIQYLNKYFKGETTVRLLPSSPVQLGNNTYAVTVKYTLNLPIEQFGAGWFTGNDQFATTAVVTKTVMLSPAKKYSARVDVDFGEQTVAYADRGTAGGYTRRRLSGDPFVTISVEGFSRVAQ